MIPIKEIKDLIKNTDKLTRIDKDKFDVNVFYNWIKSFGEIKHDNSHNKVTKYEWKVNRFYGFYTSYSKLYEATTTERMYNNYYDPISFVGGKTKSIIRKWKRQYYLAERFIKEIKTIKVSETFHVKNCCLEIEFYYDKGNLKPKYEIRTIKDFAVGYSKINEIEFFKLLKKGYNEVEQSNKATLKLNAVIKRIDKVLGEIQC